jgi:MraZ protein
MERRALLPAFLPFIAQVELMFLGEYRHSVDDKGRLTVPARFRHLLEDGGGYINQGIEPNLIVWPRATFEHMAGKVDNLPYTDQDGREFGRLFFSSAAQFELDSSGRILLPQFLRDQYGLSGELVLVGLGKFFEIWLPDQWATNRSVQRTPEKFNKLNDLMKNSG